MTRFFDSIRILADRPGVHGFGSCCCDISWSYRVLVQTELLW